MMSQISVQSTPFSLDSGFEASRFIGRLFICRVIFLITNGQSITSFLGDHILMPCNNRVSAP